MVGATCSYQLKEAEVIKQYFCSEVFLVNN